MTAKSIIQTVAARVKIPIPTTVQSSSDEQVVQLLALLNEMFEDFVLRSLWQQNTVEKVHTTLAAADQGDIRTLCPGFVNIVDRSFFSRTGNLRVYYGLTPEQWQSRQTVGGMEGPSYWARLRQNHLFVDPTPPAGETWAWEYRSEYFCVDAASSELKQYLVNDGDTLVIPERIAHAWLTWKWKAAKGFDYADDFVRYEAQIDLLSKRNNGPQIANMGKCEEDIQAGVVIPIGSWELP